jgi:hypothetical protein
VRMAGEGKAEEVKRESRILLGPEYLRQLEGPVPEIEPFVVNRGQKCPPALQFLADSRQQVAKPSSQPAKKRRASSRSAAGNPPIFASLTLLATFEVALRPIRRGFSPLMARGLGGMALLAVQMDARRHSSARPPSREPPRVGRRPTRRSASSSVRWPVTRLREIRVRAPSSGGLRGIVRLKALLAGKR